MNGVRAEHGQSTVEILGIVPACLLAAATLVTCGSAVRDQIVIDHAASAAAIAVVRGEDAEVAAKRAIKNSGRRNLQAITVEASKTAVTVSVPVHVPLVGATKSISLSAHVVASTERGRS